MPVPNEVFEQALTPDPENKKIYIDCPECNEYERIVDGEEHDSAKEAAQQARRQLGSHYAQKHMQDGKQKKGARDKDWSNTPVQAQNQATTGQQGQAQSQGSGLNERELIYERGHEGLEKIKQARLDNWLDVTDGVGSKTSNRISMLFGRNERYRRDPNALYEMLNDQLSASPSYVNSIVQDVFAPEREHEDLLADQGYVPWYKRNDMQGSPGMQQQSNMQNSMGPQPRGMQGTGNAPGFKPNMQQQGQQPITHDEAAAMMQQSLQNAEQADQRDALARGLSEATDKAILQMADNVGGLAGTLQRVFDEALVSYARENPEWVVENMSVLQKFMGAVEEMPDDNERTAPPQDRKVDEAVNQTASPEPEPEPDNSNEQPDNIGGDHDPFSDMYSDGDK